MRTYLKITSGKNSDSLIESKAILNVKTSGEDSDESTAQRKGKENERTNRRGGKSSKPRSLTHSPPHSSTRSTHLLGAVSISYSAKT